METFFPWRVALVAQEVLVAAVEQPGRRVHADLRMADGFGEG